MAKSIQEPRIQLSKKEIAKSLIALAALFAIPFALKLLPHSYAWIITIIVFADPFIASYVAFPNFRSRSSVSNFEVWVRSISMIGLCFGAILAAANVVINYDHNLYFIVIPQFILFFEIMKFDEPKYKGFIDRSCNPYFFTAVSLSWLFVLISSLCNSTSIALDVFSFIWIILSALAAQSCFKQIKEFRMAQVKFKSNN